MKKEFKKEQKRLIHSFKYAFSGIRTSIKEEKNMQIHITIMLLVIYFGIFFQIRKEEWMLCILLFGFVISMELINTAIETTIDLCYPKEHPKAKIAKDVAAGAVLIAAIVSAIIGLMIFLPKIF